MPRPTPDWDGSVSQYDKDDFAEDQANERAQEAAEEYQRTLDEVARDVEDLDNLTDEQINDLMNED